MIKRVLSIFCVLAMAAQLPQALSAQESVSDALQVQGEYTGHCHLEGGSHEAGAQVISLGNNEYSLTLYNGGLPGDGWTADMSRHELKPATMKDGSVTFQNEEFTLVLSGDTIQVKNPAGKKLGSLGAVDRKSKTLGMKPPEGAIVLFDGESNNQFKAQDGKDPVADGMLRQGILSEPTFAGNFKLHIEFKLPFEDSKRGQGRGNSGIYVQGRYEVQMLDSFGLTGEHNECGGIYSVKKPDLNMCYPPESWQTYDIEFKSAKWDGDQKSENARMTVYHNGVLIHEDVEVPKSTTASPLKESAEPGYIFLQNHGSPVRYRNVWVQPE